MSKMDGGAKSNFFFDRNNIFIIENENGSEIEQFILFKLKDYPKNE